MPGLVVVSESLEQLGLREVERERCISVGSFNMGILLLANGESFPVRYAGSTNQSISTFFAPGCALDSTRSTHTLSQSATLSK